MSLRAFLPLASSAASAATTSSFFTRLSFSSGTASEGGRTEGDRIDLEDSHDVIGLPDRLCKPVSGLPTPSCLYSLFIERRMMAVIIPVYGVGNIFDPTV